MTTLTDKNTREKVPSADWNTLLDKIQNGADRDVKISDRGLLELENQRGVLAGTRIATEFDTAKHAGTDADPWTRTSFAAALADAGSGGVVEAPPGTYDVNTQIDLTNPFVTLAVYGKVRLTGATGTAGFRLGNEAGSTIDFLSVYIHRIDGQGKANGRDGLLIRNCQQSVIRVDDILGCRYGLHFRQMTDAARWAENSFYFRDIHASTKAIYFQNPDAGVGAPVAHEGNELLGGSIFSCDAGLEIDTTVSCGGLWMTGTIDNVAVGGSTDYVNGGGSVLGNVLLLKFLREANSTFHPEDVVISPNYAALHIDVTPVVFGSPTAGMLLLNESGFLLARARGAADASRILLKETSDITKVTPPATAAAIQIYGGTQEYLGISALKDTRFDISVNPGSGSLRPLAFVMGAQLAFQLNTDGTIRINNTAGTERLGFRQGTAGGRGVLKMWDVTLGAFRYAYIDNGAWVISATEPT